MRRAIQGLRDPSIDRPWPISLCESDGRADSCPKEAILTTRPRCSEFSSARRRIRKAAGGSSSDPEVARKDKSYRYAADPEAHNRGLYRSALDLVKISRCRTDRHTQGTGRGITRTAAHDRPVLGSERMSWRSVDSAVIVAQSWFVQQHA